MFVGVRLSSCGDIKVHILDLPGARSVTELTVPQLYIRERIRRVNTGLQYYLYTSHVDDGLLSQLRPVRTEVPVRHLEPGEVETASPSFGEDERFG